MSAPEVARRMGNKKLPEHTLLGTAVGDAFGLFSEGLPSRVTSRRENWVPKIAVLSDDTEHSFLVAQSLIRAEGDPNVFRKKLKHRLIFWLLAAPPGVGFGTARSLIKLLLGGHEGVFSGGNGAAMRAPIIGATYPNDPSKIRAFVSASTTLTHTDPRAFVGALAVALAAGAGERGEDWRDVFQRVSMDVEAAPNAEQWKTFVARFSASLEAGDGVADYAAKIDCEKGVTGYVYHTVPVALYAWARYDNPELGLVETWKCGGDTDTVGAIAGALLFSKAGRSPSKEWLEKIKDFPVTTKVLESASSGLSQTGRPASWAWFLMPARNLILFPFILFYAIFFLLPKKWFSG